MDASFLILNINVLHSSGTQALAQGLGLSVLVRAYKELKKEKISCCSPQSLDKYEKEINEGEFFVDEKGKPLDVAEYILEQPTHIVNGFIWSCGVFMILG